MCEAAVCLFRFPVKVNLTIRDPLLGEMNITELSLSGVWSWPEAFYTFFWVVVRGSIYKMCR